MPLTKIIYVNYILYDIINDGLCDIWKRQTVGHVYFGH